MTRIQVPRDEHTSYPDPDRRRSTPGTRKLSGVVRGQKALSEAKTEARVQPQIAKVLGVPEPEPEADDLAALRAQAKADREAAASARRRAEAAKARL